MKAKIKSKIIGSLPTPAVVAELAKKIDCKELLHSAHAKVRAYHFVAVIGLFSVLIGYLSVAPPTDLPNWPLYSLNARTWQFFEGWGQHVKPYHVRLMQTALQHLESRALYIITHLEIPDILSRAGQPLSCEEIKMAVDKELGYDPLNLPYLCRILHASAHFDFLQETSDHKYTLTPLSEYLTSGHSKSLQNFIKFFSGDEALVVSTAISRSIFSGNSGFKEVYRKELLEHFKMDAQLQQAYDAGVSDFSRISAPAIIADYPPFGSCHHICDIGGGVGSFLHHLLEYYDYQMKGTNFDLPDVIENSVSYMKAKQIGSERIALIHGNFTEALPKFECDCYILKDILENWSDEDASMILQNLHPLLKPNDKVVIIERILHTGRHSEEKFKALLDLTMMSFNPSHSRLRTAEELHFLLEEAGFVEPSIYYTRAGYNIMETSSKIKH